MDERIIPLIGHDNLKKIKTKTILIVGLGGVGGIVAEALVRSGIEKLILIDSDTFEESNLNRQIMATSQNLKQNKTDVTQKRLLDINTKIKVETLNIFLNKDNISNLQDLKIDYIIDACDTIATKVLLIQYALANKIKIISSMGTGKRLNPQELKISTLDKTYNDPLAKIMRKLIKEQGIKAKIPVVFSSELPINNEKVIASMMFVPATAGLMLAYYVINDIIKS